MDGHRPGMPRGPQGSTGGEKVGVGVGDEGDAGLGVVGGGEDEGDEEDAGLGVVGDCEDEGWPVSGVVDGGEVDGGGSDVDGGFDGLAWDVDELGYEGTTHTPPTTSPSGQLSVGVGVSGEEAGGLEGVGVSVGSDDCESVV